MKLISLFLLIGSAFFQFSCSGISRINSGPSVYEKSVKHEFAFTDKSGEYRFIREVGVRKEKNEFVVKYQLLPYYQTSPIPLEKGISISTIGILKKKIRVLRPKISQYSVWFDKKKYLNQLKIDINRKSMILTLKSPEKQWDGTETVPFPRGTGVFCYFSQLMECVHTTGFVDRAVENEGGIMNFHVIWDGHPYFYDQYTNIPNNLFAPAQLVFDTKNRKGEMRFTLRVAGQEIVYMLNAKKSFIKMFWTAQGLSIVRRNVKDI